MPSSVFSPFGASGGKNGVGGSLYVPLMFFTTIAEIGSGTKIHLGDAEDLIVDAKTKVLNFSLVQAGSQASDGFGISGAISFVGIFNTTIARIASTISVIGGGVQIKAVDETTNVNLVGSIAMGTSAAVGISLAINTLVRDVYALVGNLEDGVAGPWEVSFSGNGNQAAIVMTVVPEFNGAGEITTLTEGAVDTHEVQWIETNASQGQFVLAYGLETTTALNWNASAAEIQSALNALSGLAADGGVTVTGAAGEPWAVTFNTIGAKKLITSAAVTSGTPFIGHLTTEETNGGSSTYEVQNIKNDATGKDLIFSYNGSSTIALPYDVSAATLQAALVAIGANVVVTMNSLDTWTITFTSTGDKSAITTQYDAEVVSSLYVEGATNTPEQQHLQVVDATQGAYALEFQDELSMPLAWNATASQIQDALNALTTIKNTNTAGTGYVTVLAVSDGFTITFSEIGDVDEFVFISYDDFDGSPSVHTSTEGTGYQ